MNGNANANVEINASDSDNEPEITFGNIELDEKQKRKITDKRKLLKIVEEKKRKEEELKDTPFEQIVKQKQKTKMGISFK